MKYLIDTQILIWSIVSQSKIKKSVKGILQNNDILVSRVSLFEIAIKQKLGKLPELTLSTDALVAQAIKDNFTFIHVENSHVASYNSVPLFDDHRDPFDRLLIATALSENIPIISADENFKNYASIITLIEA